MTTSNYITLEDLEVALGTALSIALKPVIDRLDRIEQRLDRMEVELRDVRGRTNQMYDALERHGLPLQSREGQ